MRLINASYEILDPPVSNNLSGVYKHIELCGRTCYKSEDRIMPGSAPDFVERMLQSKHYSVLEHGTIYLTIPKKNVLLSMDRLKYDCILSNPYSKCIEDPDNYYITTNYRVIVENNLQDLSEYITYFTDKHEPRVTVRFICSRGIANEFVRHRHFSFSQESTRYCNYNKDKFDNQLTFIKPYWCNLEPGTYSVYDPIICKLNEEITEKDYTFFINLSDVQGDYNALISAGCIAQEAREILPLCTKTELIMTGFLSDWREFFNQRALGTTGAPHPDAKYLAEPLMHDFKQRFNYE